MSTTIRPAQAGDMPVILPLVEETFAVEQQIPRHLIPLPPEKQPRWWCVEEDGALRGAVAAWQEGEETHMGRFVIAPSHRGRHLGAALAQYAVAQVLQTAPRIHMDARDETVRIMVRLGAEVTGPAVPFFVGTVTPLVLERSAFHPFTP